MNYLAVYHSSNRGYVYYELFRLLWHYLHWWSLLVGAAVVTVIERLSH